MAGISPCLSTQARQYPCYDQACSLPPIWDVCILGLDFEALLDCRKVMLGLESVQVQRVAAASGGAEAEGQGSVCKQYPSQRRTMASFTNEIMQILYTLVAKEELEVETNITKGTVISGACAAVGVVLGGPCGLVAGVAAGAVLGICFSKSSKCLTDVLKGLTPDTKQKLCAGLWQLLKELVCWAVDVLIAMLLGDTKLKNVVVDFIRSFFEGSLKMTIKKKA
ncbi:uncharacterized protein LOC118803874 [Colossoma macropomum]|uniref:uncharacterized protein LOC118803874 n=1 Tax=Colossoma macropomum TaxID=42526 RepID=UPI001864CB11|nr:uncharacterized protein LOC118803874 [Colossoma macropomum]